MTASSIWRYGFTWHPPSHFFHWYSFASLGIDPAFMTTLGPPIPRNGVVSCIPGTPRLSRNIVRTQHRKRKFRFLSVLNVFFASHFHPFWGYPPLLLVLDCTVLPPWHRPCLHDDLWATKTSKRSRFRHPRHPQTI